MQDLANRLKDVGSGGIFQLACNVRAVERAAEAAGLACFRVDIHAVHDKGDLLAVLAKGMDFPDWFGGNWDALADCLTDLSWKEASGYILVLDRAKHFAAAHEHDYDAALEVMQHAADYWRDADTPFWVFIAGPEGWKSGLPEWPAATQEDD